MAIDARERAALAEAVREAAATGPRGHLTEGDAPRRDGGLWKVLTDQMGLTGLLVAEEHGGAGAGIAEAAVVLEELARQLAVVPSLSSIGMATALLRVVDTPEAHSLLGELAAGAVTAAVAWPAPEGYDVTPSLAAIGSCTPGRRVAVSGRAEFVVDGLDADILLAPARCDDVDVVVSIDASDAWVQRTTMNSLDLTRGLSVVEFTEAPGTVLGSKIPVQVALDLALVLIAAEQIGIGQQCHDAATAWAKERVQFDRPIGQFQAIKHQLVSLLMELELARSSLEVAIESADQYLKTPTPAAARALGVAASVAKARCGDAAMLVADESLHILGGIGFTWEHDAHLYFRRAKTLEVLLGTPDAHRRRFSTMLLEDAVNA